MKDRLFLLSPGFFKEQQGPFYCADSVPIEGLLSLFPSLHELIEVNHVSFQKPREMIVALLGTDNQSAPVLVLGTDENVVEDVAVKTVGGERYIDNEGDIRRYLSKRFALPTAA